MLRRYPLLILLTMLVLLACAAGIWSQFQPAFTAPFTATLTDAHSVTVQALPGVPLPSGLETGDRLDLPAMDFSGRYLVLPLVNDDATYRGVSGSYPLAVHRGDKRFTVPVTSVDLLALSPTRLYAHLSIGSYLFNVLVFAVLALLVLWRGRERAAAGLALWVVANLLGVVAINLHFGGRLGMDLIMTAEVLYLLARIGLYLMVEFMVGTAFSTRVLWLWRGLFISVLIAGAVPQIAGSALFLTVGWTGLLFPVWQGIWVMGYLIPVAMLFLSYRLAPTAARLRLRWMLWSGALWVIGIGIFDLRPFGLLGSNILGTLGNVLATIGFLYAVLRYRAVDVSVAIDRTLVYGSVTALVVGVLAAVQSVVQHAALGTSASVLLQIVVPLALGIVLGQVRSYADQLVERVFFRHKYLAEKALRLFAQSCGGYENSGELLTATVRNIHQKIKAVSVAIYERGDTQYRQTHYAGPAAYPQTAGIDDEAFAAVRSGQEDIDLSELHSAVGTNGFVFAMGRQAVLVCANRPGEHYAADERKLLRYIALQVGAALDALRMQEVVTQLKAKASLVDAVLAGTLPASAKLKARARELASVSVTA